MTKAEFKNLVAKTAAALLVTAPALSVKAAPYQPVQGDFQSVNCQLSANGSLSFKAKIVNPQGETVSGYQATPKSVMIGEDVSPTFTIVSNDKTASMISGVRIGRRYGPKIRSAQSTQWAGDFLPGCWHR